MNEDLKDLQYPTLSKNPILINKIRSQYISAKTLSIKARKAKNHSIILLQQGLKILLKQNTKKEKKTIRLQQKCRRNNRVSNKINRKVATRFQQNILHHKRVNKKAQ
jgi:hypothetical protein